MKDDCATEGCGKPATHHFEREGIGSWYCDDCFARVTALVRMRDRLPDRRTAETFPVDFIALPGTERQHLETMTVTVGRYPDGRIGEVFVDCDNHLNEKAVGLWHDLGVIISIALQRGATLMELSNALARIEVNYMGTMRLMPHSSAGALLEALVDLQARDVVEGVA